MSSRQISPDHPAGGDGVVHPVQAAEKGRFAAAGRSDHGQDLIAADIDADFIDGAFVPVIDLHIPAGHARIVDKRGADGFPAGCLWPGLGLLQIPGQYRR